MRKQQTTNLVISSVLLDSDRLATVCQQVSCRSAQTDAQTPRASSKFGISLSLSLCPRRCPRCRCPSRQSRTKPLRTQAQSFVATSLQSFSRNGCFAKSLFCESFDTVLSGFLETLWFFSRESQQAALRGLSCLLWRRELGKVVILQPKCCSGAYPVLL